MGFSVVIWGFVTEHVEADLWQALGTMKEESMLRLQEIKLEIQKRVNCC